MQSRSPGWKAWAALAVGVGVWECVCPPNQLLSEEVDRWLVSNPILTRLIVVVTAAHLLNVLPVWVDPYAYAARVTVWRVRHG